MINRILDYLRPNKVDAEYSIPVREINPQYIINGVNKQEYQKKGYTIVRNAVDNDSIKEVEDTFEKIKMLPEYFESDKLQTTIAFGEEAHNMAIRTLKKIGKRIFPNILDESRCKFDFGGGIIVKNKGCWFAPHQDCSIIDEYKGTTTYAWIPTVDMTSENGTFYAISGSHLWAAWQRSSQYPSWPLIPYNDLLWKNMIPIQVNKGDILLFDSALIHASGNNTTNSIRLAFSICIIDKNAEHVQYVIEKDTPKGKIEKFIVDEEYWYKGKLWGRPQGYTQIIEDKIYPNQLSKDYVLRLIKKYNPND